ncbi:MAG TPA: hypothetical protein VKZ63_01510, partial [Kofleriaceae bacterium]|nr:hypothetical protein [Kofleriaceae bacterium]
MSRDELTAGARGGARPRALAHALTAALLAGVMAGAAAGLIDGLWSWRVMAQFSPEVGGRVRALLFLAAACGLCGGLVGAAGALAWAGLMRGTRLGAIAAALLAAHRAARARDPREALIGLSLVLAGVPALAGALSLAYALAFSALGTRKHIGLVIASAMAIALAALCAAAVAALVLGRVIELGLARLARRPAWARALSSPLAPPAAGLALLAAAGVAAAVWAWDTLSLLRLRP